MASTTHTTTTTISVSPQFDAEYLYTLPGKLKAGEVGLALLGFILYMILYTSCSGSYFGTVAIVSFTFSGILLLFYLFHIIEWLNQINWILLELIYCGIFAILYLIGSIILCTCLGYSVYLFIPAVIGFLAVGLFGFDCYVKYLAWRNGELAQVSKITTTTTVSSYP